MHVYVQKSMSIILPLRLLIERGFEFFQEETCLKSEAGIAGTICKIISSPDKNH
jgi:hypothetical protein